LYYTSPTGGFAFLYKICITAGIVFALPAILYNCFKFLEPVLEKHQRKGTLKYIFWSFLLAYIGIAFAYYISLPSALKFLTGFGEKTGNVESLINVNEYFSFALAYVGGFAALFQLPIIILFINRIKPLKPMQMMKAQRYIIVGSFIVAAILTPTPDPFNQMMMAAPMVILYQFSIAMIWCTNRKRNRGAYTADLVSEEAYDTIMHEDTAPEPLPERRQLRPVTDVMTPAFGFTGQPVMEAIPVPVEMPENEPDYELDVRTEPIKRTVQRVGGRSFSDIVVQRPLPNRAQTKVADRRPTTIDPVERQPIMSMPNNRMLIGNDFF
jgi:sec-independent protein translocase protein TatC